MGELIVFWLPIIGTAVFTPIAMSEFYAGRRLNATGFALVGILSLALVGLVQWKDAHPQRGPGIVLPPNLPTSRLSITGFSFPPKDPSDLEKGRILRITFRNTGAIAADTPVISHTEGTGPINASLAAIISGGKQGLHQLRPIALASASKPRPEQQLEPEVDFAFEDKINTAFSAAEWAEVVAHRQTAMVIVTANYRDDAIGADQVWLTDFVGTVTLGEHPKRIARYNRTRLYQLR